MSDLQCPARFLLLSEPDASLAETLRPEHVAAVYDGPPDTGATALGDALGLRVRVLARPIALSDVLAREPETMADLRDLADLHRGETVVVLAEGDPGRRVVVEVDADGIRLERSTPGVSG